MKGLGGMFALYSLVFATYANVDKYAFAILRGQTI
jgi:hypothetical protein